MFFLSNLNIWSFINDQIIHLILKVLYHFFFKFNFYKNYFMDIYLRYTLKKAIFVKHSMILNYQQIVRLLFDIFYFIWFIQKTWKTFQNLKHFLINFHLKNKIKIIFSFPANTLSTRSRKCLSALLITSTRWFSEESFKWRMEDVGLERRNDGSERSDLWQDLIIMW